MECGRDLYCILDTAASIENAILAAKALELSSCWVSAFDEEAIRKAVRLPEYIRPIALVPLGYSAEETYRIPRLPLEEFVHAEYYGQSWRKKL